MKSIISRAGRSNENLSRSLKRAVDFIERKKKKKRFPTVRIFFWLSLFGKIYEISKRRLRIRSQVVAQRDNDQRYPIFGDPPFYNVPFSRMHERTKTRGVTLVYFSVWTFFEQSCINISFVWREIYSTIYSFHPSNIVFIVANALKYAILS